MEQKSAEELSRLIVNEAVDAFESLLNEGDLNEVFEFGDPELTEGATRFADLYKKDPNAALAGILMSSMITADVFLDTVTQTEEDEASEEDA